MRAAYRMAHITSDIHIWYKNGVGLMTSPQRTAHDLSHILTTVLTNNALLRDEDIRQMSEVYDVMCFRTTNN